MPHMRLKKVKEFFSNHGSIYWQQNKYAAEILSNRVSFIWVEHKPPSGLKTADGVLEALTLVSLQ